MSSNPYENEPGFENSNTDDDKKNQKDYVAKVRDIALHDLLVLNCGRFVTRASEFQLYSD
jgi:hypothetical protein